MFKKIVVPALVALGVLGASLAPVARAQKPTPAPKMGGKMDKMKPKSDKKMPARGKDGKFIKKSDKKPTPAPKMGGKMSGGKMSGGRMGDKMSGGKRQGTTKMSGATGKPMWDAKINRWRLNGRFISEADAMKMGGKK